MFDVFSLIFDEYLADQFRSLFRQAHDAGAAVREHRLYFKVRAYPRCLIFSRRPFAAASGSFAP
jgi:hypothetical protein